MESCGQNLLTTPAEGVTENPMSLSFEMDTGERHTYGGHGDHEEVDTVPVGEAPHTLHLVGVREIWRIPAVL
jgi:hypothetical protein